MKEYEKPELEIIIFENEDILTQSGEDVELQGGNTVSYCTTCFSCLRQLTPKAGILCICSKYERSGDKPDDIGQCNVG